MRVWLAELPSGLATAQRNPLASEDQSISTVLRSRRNRFVADMLQRQPEELEFVVHQGQPAVVGAADFHFSTSYSGNAMALACADRKIGVDLEEFAPDSDNKEAAHQLFHPDELDLLEGKPPEAWTRAFYLIWTQKEALAKALGEGFGIEFSNFAVSLDGGPIDCSRLEIATGPWYSKAVVVRDRYAVAVAYGQPIAKIEVERLPRG